MLVLTRKANQSVVIGGSIVVRVLHVTRDQVRLGIDAPPEVQVHREEVFLALQQANRDAAATDAAALSRLACLATGASDAEPSGRSPAVVPPD